MPSKRRLMSRTVYRDFTSTQTTVVMLGPNEKRTALLISVVNGWAMFQFGEGGDPGVIANSPPPNGFMVCGQLGSAGDRPWNVTEDHIGQAIRESVYVNDSGTSCRVSVLEVWEVDCPCDYQAGK